VIGFDEAVALLTPLARPLGVESVALAQARGRVLAAPVRAESDSPLTTVSSMDGWAVREENLAMLPARLRIVGESRPGRAFFGPLADGECARVFTGAAVPDGCNRVVVQEVVQRDGDRAVFDQAAQGSRFIRQGGSDFRAGETLLDAGARLTPQALVAAAAADIAKVETVRPPQILVLATGDELAEPGQARKRTGAIPDSASLGVAALAQAWGAEVLGRERLTDDLDVMVPAAHVALDRADVVVVIGGASVGERDFARAMFEPAGLELVFSKVAIKPGKPVWLGRVEARLVLGLPGNPTSALVTARLFLAPLLAGLSGRNPAEALDWRPAPLAAPLPATDERETFFRAAFGPDGVAPLSDQDSGAQKTLAQARRLIRRRAGAAAAQPGETVETLEI
jgi:molybdopterin molybdotransferase